eukprot:14103020-Alexandrium_andersonii.AAC.1
MSASLVGSEMCIRDSVLGLFGLEADGGIGLGGEAVVVHGPAVGLEAGLVAGLGRRTRHEAVELSIPGDASSAPHAASSVLRVGGLARQATPRRRRRQRRWSSQRRRRRGRTGARGR